MVAGLLAATLGGLYALQRKLIYFPEAGPVPAAAEVLPGGRDLTLHTSDDLRLSAWYFPADDGPTVLFAPGNGGNRAGRVDIAHALTEAGFGVLLVDYRGYGDNPGSPSEDGLYADVRAARSALLEEGVKPERLVYFGESIGCGPISDLAVEHPPAALLLRSPFVDLASVGAEQYPLLPVRMLLRDRFPVRDNVSELDGVPTAVVYGTADDVVPPSLSGQVADAAGARKVAVEGADHNDFAVASGPAVIDALRDLTRGL